MTTILVGFLVSWIMYPTLYVAVQQLSSATPERQFIIKVAAQHCCCTTTERDEPKREEEYCWILIITIKIGITTVP